jgi:hypothetical protein
VSGQKRNGSQVAGLRVDLGCLRPPHPMRAVGVNTKSSPTDPKMDNPPILAGREVGLRAEAAREQIPSTPRVDLEPVLDRCSGLFGNLELHRWACFLLNDCGAVPYSAASGKRRRLVTRTRSQLLSVLSMARLNKARSRLTVLQLKPNCPNVLRLQGTLLPDQTLPVPGSILRSRR